MKIKSLLIGSAAALASASVVNAADAIVAAEPEAVEYVRVCDAFGTGFFYIPGTETCLKVGGYVRFQVDFRENNSGTSGATTINHGTTSDWDAFTRAQIQFDARTETELGALRSFIDLRGDADNANASGVTVYQAFIELGGLRVGKFDSWWDASLSGETDVLNNRANFNSIRYNYDAGSWSFGMSVDELENTGTFIESASAASTVATKTFSDNNVGIAANLGLSLDAINFSLLGGYDIDREQGAVRAMLTAQVGPGVFGLAGVYASGANAYFAASEWAIAAEYAVSVTDRLKLTPGVQWFGNLAPSVTTISGTSSSTTVVSNHWTDNDAWRAGLTVDYKITNGLDAKLAATYIDADGADETWTGFVRLQRSF